MAYFDAQGQSWAQQPRRPESWGHSGPPSSAGASTPGSIPPPVSSEDMHAFGSQFEEIARASENLHKNIRMLGTHGRRESLPNTGPFSRQYPDFDSRTYGSIRPHSVSDYDPMRAAPSHPQSSVQGYLAHQRFGSRQSEADQAMQAKRRAAAQRERELRNYHQEQQFNRTGPKSDRSMSPSTGLSEDDRRDLLARQHRALYGDGSNLYLGGDSSQRQTSQDARVIPGSGTSSHGPPSAGPFEASFQPPSNSSTDGAGPATAPSGAPQQQPRSRTNSTTSKSPNPSAFPMFESAQQIARTSASSPAGSPTHGGTQASTVGPIGSRPVQGSNQGSRKTPPMPSPLGYGFSSDKSGVNANNGNNNVNIHHATERSSSSASNPTPTTAPEKSHLGGWSGQGGPWGPSKNLGVQASVWG